jgi:DNA modification methylase
LIELENAVVFHGSNLDVLPTLPDNSVDAIVTDPPYELGFMGKSWDSSGIAYSVELWQECLRVLKPGGHLLAFGGSRTWHRIAVAIEDAGFDVRDSIAWLYGSGFPKSLDVSKAIDKNNGKHQVDLTPFGNYVRELREAKGWSRKELDDLMGTNTAVSWWEGRASGVQLPSKLIYNRLKEVIGMDDRFDSLIDWAEAEREVIGTKISGIANAEEKDRHTIGASKAVQVDITAPATDEAKKWQGWGTALKPAFEPIVVARKPLVGTVAANVLLWGVGGLNIDGSRIGTEQRDVTVTEKGFGSNFMDDGWQPSGNSYEKSVTGRWPANIILDEHTAGLLDEQSGVSTSQGGNRRVDRSPFATGENEFEPVKAFGDTGGASRFFYVAKASKKDRNEGLEDLEGKEIGAKGNGLGRTCATCAASVLDGCECADRTFVNPTRQNFHPTVKPTALMEYLVKLVTPPGGTVLDPFTGSGSTGKAALLNGFKFIGIELTEDYLPIIEGRLKHAAETYAAKATEEETKEQETLF